MRLSFFMTIVFCLLAAALFGCGGAQSAEPLETPVSVEASVPVEPPVSVESPVPLRYDSALFLDTNEAGAPPAQPQIVRHRFVKVNLDLLLDSSGKARSVEEFTINLFPDVVYTGVIEEVEFDGGGYSWTGYLKDVEYSSLFMVYTAGVFIGHFASPGGIYEVSVAGEGDIYRVVLIDQQNMPEGGD